MNLHDITAYDRALGSFIEVTELATKARPNEPQWRKLRRIADQFEPKVMREFLNAVASVQDGTAIGAVRDALSRGDVEGAIERIPWEKLGQPYIERQLTPQLRQALRQAGEVTMRAIPREGAAFAVDNPRVAAFLDRRGADLVVEIGDEQRTALRSVLRQSLDSGLPAQETAQLVKPLVGLTEREMQAVANYRARLVADEASPATIAREVDQYSARLHQARALRIARTETSIAVNQGAREAWQQRIDDGTFEASELQREWVAVIDDATDEDCAALDGVTVGWDESFPGGAEPGELHPNCVVGETIVSPGGALSAVSVRPYNGDLLIIRTAAGNSLTCTPNHPILTNCGWVPARCIHIGSNVVSAGSSEWMRVVNQHAQNIPASIHDVAKAFGSSFGVASVPVPMSAEYFHGDGEGSEVAIVWANRLLRDGHNSPSGKHELQMAFILADIRRHLFACLRSGNEALVRRLLAAHRIVRSFRERLSLLWSSASHASVHRIASPAWGYASFQQPTPYAASVYLVPSRQRQFGLTGGISSSDLRNGKVAPDARSSWPTTTAEHLALAARLRADAVVDVMNVSANTHVYNLQSGTETYLSEGIVSHNCRCVAQNLVRD